MESMHLGAFLQCLEDGGAPKPLVGESDIHHVRQGGEEVEVSFKSSHEHHSEEHSCLGVRVRLTSHRLLLSSRSSEDGAMHGKWWALRLDEFTDASLQPGGFFQKPCLELFNVGTAIQAGQGAPALRWLCIKNGEPIPQDAVVAKENRPKEWVGRYKGEAGKIVSCGNGLLFQSFVGHHSGRLDAAEILCCTAQHSWRPMRRGQPIPANAVRAGQTRSDGRTYVARHSAEPTRGEAGKINVDGGGNQSGEADKMYNFWGPKAGCHQDSCEILVVGQPEDGEPTAGGSGPRVAMKTKDVKVLENLQRYLQTAIKAAAWRQSSFDATVSGGLTKLRQQQSQQQKAVGEELDLAFTDLDALKDYAKQTVAAVRKVAAAHASSQAGKAEASESIGRLLEEFGLVSQDGSAVSLSGGELASDIQADVVSVCKAALTKRGSLGMLMAHDVFCLVNRARGTSLVSPEEVMTALRAASRSGGPLRLRNLDKTNAVAVSLASASDAEADAVLLTAAAKEASGLSAFSLSTQLGLNLAEARYVLRDAENRSVLVRDDAPEDVYYFKNAFNEF